MLKVPAYAYFPDQHVTAFQDDSMWWKFYLIPDFPSIRRDQNGNPVFLLIKYAFSDEDRAKDAKLPVGGGYLNFDVELAVSPADLEAVKKQLQEFVKQDWQKLKDAADGGGKDVRGFTLSSWHYLGDKKQTTSLGVDDVLLGLDPAGPLAPPGDKPPLVVIDYPTWTKGTFKVLAPQSAGLISNRVAEGPASLVGDNVAAANMDLTDAGATFMQKTLVDPSGAGGTDLTPIQVVYDLKFKARLPPVRLHITADTRNLYMALREVDHQVDHSDGCDGGDTTGMRQYETQMAMAIQSGLINVQFDTGFLDLKDDFMKSLQEMAQQIVGQMIKNTFYDKSQSGQPGQPADPNKPNADDPATKFQDSDINRYSLKQVSNFSSMHFEYNETLASSTDWSIAPQATMQTFFAGMSAEQLKHFVRVVNLDDDFFKTLGLTVTAFAAFDKEPIAFIEVQMRYTGRDQNNQDVEKVQTFTFTKDKKTDTWDPTLINGKREYEYRWRVGFDGHTPGDFSDWQADTTPNLNIAIENPGKISIDVQSGNIDWNQTVDQVQVELSYADPSNNIEEQDATFILKDGALTQKYERYIYTKWNKPARYRTHFFLKSGAQIDSDWTDTVNRDLLINEPFFDKLDVSLVPAGNWAGVVQTVVSVRYTDEAHSYHIEKPWLLKKADEYKDWLVVLRDPNLRKFQYKVLTTFQDGHFSETNWLNADGDQALPVIVQQQPLLLVKLLPSLIDFKVTPVVEVTLHYDDVKNNLHNVETFTFTGTDIQTWSLPIKDDTLHSYRYQITYHQADGHNVPVAEATMDETSLVIPKLVVPEVAVTMLPKLVAFAETPVVEVNIEYQDPKNHINDVETFEFTDATNQSYRLQVKPDSPLQYQIGVTYYLADGKKVDVAPIPLDKKQIVIPRYLPAAT